jgi:glutamine amidotransferase
MTVSIVDYGLGNLGSIANMLNRVGAESRRVSTPEEIIGSDRLLLPGIGSFDTGIRLLDELELAPAIKQFAATGKPVLGICLGMQILLDSSEEGRASGLGLIRGRSLRFQEETGTRVPHMGWNLVEPVRTDPLVADLPDESRFYFVHSYRVVPENKDHVLAVTRYGSPFASMIRSGNVMGAQYHPEKSHAFGMRVLSNFVMI